MKNSFKFLLVILFVSSLTTAQNLNESWDTYIASYENDKPGSTTLRMDLYDLAPIKSFNYVLVTGITYKTSRNDGFPEKETLKLLYKAADAVTEIIKKETESISVGSFTHDKERLEYFYIKTPKNVASKIEQFYKDNYPKYKFYLNIKEDKKWKYYLDFLYPNEEIKNYMADLSVLRNLQEAGDNLTKARRVDHWLYFSDKSKLKECKEELIKSNFTIQDTTIDNKRNLTYGLQVWRIDNVDINSIYPITKGLRTLAKKYSGEYDGWETSVEKE
ncbi:DUF695 domain-containing protein [Tenacibaculum amylolyticum]|uniref:DUF695 domain-containing protein n=1 Tax=Tenacibaculum amylolyticum TaxID=104269 RepID=UPI003892DB36